MNQIASRQIKLLQSFYLFAFFGTGSIAPLLSLYLSDVEKLNGYEIGTILSIGPIMMIFFQPLWGMICDVTNAPTRILSLTTFLAGICGLGYILFNGYSTILIVAVFVAIFQSAIIPVSDSISLKYTSKVKYNYGNIRLFGSLGFGLAVFIMGRLAEGKIGPGVIFYSFFLSCLFASILALKAPKERASTKISIKSGLKELLTYKKFLIFLAITFLIFGPNLANNFFFGLFVEARGGTYAGIGTAFLVAVLSEIPFMRIAQKWIERFGLLKVVAIAGCVSLIRWVFYFTQPDLWLVYTSAVIQGFSIGLFIPAGLQYIRDITPTHIAATAVTLYAAIGNGLGNWFSTFCSGILYERYSIYAVYSFYAILAALGVLLTVWLIRMDKGSSNKKELQTGIE